MTVVDIGWRPRTLDAPRVKFRTAQIACKTSADTWAEHCSARNSATDAAQRAYAAISKLVAGRLIEASVAARAQQLIKFLFKANTVDASIAPEDGGLIFYWAAQEMSLTIEIYPSAGYWWCASNISGYPLSGEGSELPLNELGNRLNHFSKEVERRNPRWRDIIR
ncbi:hypothetical protein ACJH6J_25855 [Mycobacterium sp. SMC-18]|uniref:hypothetical protein n=1 Tax=unclassified Mycobacterium TaxID=2642494 RepID=UPI003876ADF8